MSVRDGGSTEAPLVGRYCGHNLPHNFLSTGNQLLIRFKTDSSISQEGFRASYRTGIMSLDIKNHVLCINDIVITVFENHPKSLIQYCERSELRLHFEWTKVH